MVNISKPIVATYTMKRSHINTHIKILFFCVGIASAKFCRLQNFVREIKHPTYIYTCIYICTMVCSNRPIGLLNSR